MSRDWENLIPVPNPSPNLGTKLNSILTRNPKYSIRPILLLSRIIINSGHT